MKQVGDPAPSRVGPFARLGLDYYASTYRPLPRQDTLIVHATILDGVGGRHDDADLLLKDGKVAALGGGLTAPSGAVVVEAGGAWVTPGIVDPHSHAGDFAAPYVPSELTFSDVNEEGEPNTASVWAEHSITVNDPTFSRALEGGVTTIHVLPGSINLFAGLSVTLKNVPATTIRGMKFPGAMPGLKLSFGENPKRYYGTRGRRPASRMGSVALHRQGWIEAQRHDRAWGRHERGESPEPPDRDLGLDAMAAAMRGELRVHIHCYRADDMATMMSLADEFGYRIAAFHHASEAYKIPELLVGAGVAAIVWSDWWGYKLEVYDAIRENAAFVAAAGGCVCMHSDSWTVGQRLSVEAGKAMAAGRRAGVDIQPEDAIAWVTLNPARVLGLGEHIGSLEVGKNADVVMWSGDPFSVYTRAERVFVDGAVVFDRADPLRQATGDFELGQTASARRP